MHVDGWVEDHGEGPLKTPQLADRRMRAGRGMSVALIGADGAGKSTLTARLALADLPAPAKSIYMGVNLEASSMVLPTTWLLLAVKRLRGGRPDLVATTAFPGPGRRDWRRSLKTGTRMTVWMLEEWLRQSVASAYLARGYIVLFDRHFLADYYDADVARSSQRGLASRVHGWSLGRLYPRPDLVICLDAPSATLYLRKPESDPGWLEGRRRSYVALGEVLSDFVIVDASRDLDLVFSEVLGIIRDHWERVSV